MDDIVTETYYERNKERIKARRQLPEVKAQTAERMRLYREAHPEYVEKGRLLTKKFCAENKEQRAEKAKEWRKTESGRESHNRYARKWFKTVIGKIARRNMNYKRRANTVGTFTATEWSELCEKHGNKCLCCGEQKKLTADHVIPLKLKGENVIENIQPLCHSCNSRKGAKVIDYR